MSFEEKSEWIRLKAKDLGFIGVGFSKAEFMPEEAQRLKQWLNLDYHGEMSYLANHFDKRVDPSLLVEGSKTVISLAYNYYTDYKPPDTDAPKISIYALGRDYHKVVKRQLKLLGQAIEEKWGKFSGRGFVDSAPILERDWAKRSGLGWVGKNTLLINPKKGSYFFLAELIVDFELDYDAPMKDYCGTCTKCIDACPTDAITEEGYILDSKKCISYLTIELKKDIPSEFKGKMEDWMYGCDICQEVCPWNRFSTEHDEDDFKPKEELVNMTSDMWKNLTQEKFDDLFFGSAVKRTGFSGLSRNIEFLNDGTSS